MTAGITQRADDLNQWFCCGWVSLAAEQLRDFFRGGLNA